MPAKRLYASPKLHIFYENCKSLADIVSVYSSVKPNLHSWHASGNIEIYYTTIIQS